MFFSFFAHSSLSATLIALYRAVKAPTALTFKTPSTQVTSFFINNDTFLDVFRTTRTAKQSKKTAAMTGSGNGLEAVVLK